MCNLVCPRHEALMHYFLCPGGTHTDLTKKRIGSYAELVFSHPVGSARHIVHYVESGP
jgi:hypothetical protein